MVFPMFAFFERRNNGLRASSGDGVMAGLGVVGPITTDARDDFMLTNLVIGVLA